MKPFDENAIRQAWLDYRRTRNPEHRNRLIETYIPLVRGIAERMRFGERSSFALDERISSGTLGLIEAIDRFDVDRGARFVSYGLIRIRGAILDEVRCRQWVSRPARRRAATLTRARARLRSELDREGTVFEMADELGVSVTDYQRSARDAQPPAMTSLFDRVSERRGRRGRRVVDLVADRREPDPATAAGLRDLHAHAMRCLEPRERLVVRLRYLDHLSLREIARALRVTEARVSQLHAAILAKLRDALLGSGPDRVGA